MAILAGLTGGLAAQTKYTGVSVAAAMLLYAAIFGRARLGLIASLVAVSAFSSCERLIAIVHGKSHLLNNVGRQYMPSASKWQLVAALASLIGALAPAVAVPGLVGLGLSRRLVVLAGAVIAAGFYLLGVAPELADYLLISWWFWPCRGC